VILDFPSRRLLRAAACTLGILTSLSACSLFSSSDDRNKPADLTQYPAGMSVRAIWTTGIGSGGGLGFAPAVVNDSVYAATPDGAVDKVDLNSGKVIWHTDLKTELSAGVGSNGTIAVVATPTGSVIALDDNGKVKWKASATSDVSVPPLVTPSVVVVRSGDYRIQAFDINTGDRLWNVQRPGPALALKSASQMASADNLAIVGMPGGKLFAIDSANGNVQWEGTVAVPKGGSDLERLTDVVGAPKISGRLMCAVAYQGRITCFDVSAGGRPLWAKDFSGAAGMTIDDHNAYAPDVSSVVSAFSLDTGANLWKQAALRNRQLTAPAVLSGAIAMGDFDGYVHFLSTTDGKLLARLAVGGGAVLSPPETTPRGVLVQTGDGKLLMIGTN
jgi:outer membrane protein assembly factor BamB